MWMQQIIVFESSPFPVTVAVCSSKHSLPHIIPFARGKWRVSFVQSTIGNEFDEMENIENIENMWLYVILWGSRLFQELILVLVEPTASPWQLQHKGYTLTLTL